MQKVIDIIKPIKKAIIDYPEFRCTLILMNFKVVRLSKNMVEILRRYMDFFPLKDFCKHIFIKNTSRQIYQKFERKQKK